MEKLTACFEISSDSIKVLIGYELGGVPVVLLRTKKEMPGLIKAGQIADPNALIRGLADLHNIADDTVHLRISVSEICFVLPSIGLIVYESEKTTNVVSPSNEIAKIDVTNVVSLVRKETIPEGNSIVDIIPDQFVLDDGQRYSDPPLGMRSNSLTIKAKIHALPQSVSSTYNRLVNQAGFRVKKASVSTYCIAELFKTYPDLPTSYLLVDMGARLTTVSLVGEGTPYASASFFSGGDDLTEMIAQAFDCTFAAAEKLKCEYGYRETLRAYEPALPLGEEKVHAESYYQNNLNDVIAEYLESYMAMLGNAFLTLLSRYGNQFDTLPIVFTGGASGLRGLQLFVGKTFPHRATFYPVPRSVGARDRGYAALLGLLLTSSRYVGSLEDNFRGMGTVTRVSKEKGKGKPARNSPDSDVL